VTIYRILEADGRPQVALKKGFCWPACFLGVLWALFKRFWSGAIVLFGISVVTNFLTMMAEQAGSAVLIFASWLLCWRLHLSGSPDIQLVADGVLFKFPMGMRIGASQWVRR